MPAIRSSGGIATAQPAPSDGVDDGLLHVMTDKEINDMMRRNAATSAYFDKPLRDDEDLFGEDGSDIADLTDSAQPSGRVLPTSTPAIAAGPAKKRKRSGENEAESTSQPANKARRIAGGKKKAGPK